MYTRLLESCVLCGNRCRVNRLKGELGTCRAGSKIMVASYCPHYGEEPMISGNRGSGAIFFSHCSLRCLFCQNYDISQLAYGQETGRDELVRIMLNLQEQGVHNINLVSPTHYAPQILEALMLARQQGLKIPAVYNTGGYDSVELLEVLRGKIEIYMPDFKYFDNERAWKYSGAINYVEVARAGIAEMYRQVGNIKLDREGFAASGILVRHLVLPNNLADSKKVLDYLASLSKEMQVSIMAQYNPQFRALEFPELSRRLQLEEYKEVVRYAKKIGLHNLYVQDLISSETYLPDFKKENPFI